jgi:hypothetical protein
MDAVRWIGTVLILGIAGSCGVQMCRDASEASGSPPREIIEAD